MIKLNGHFLNNPTAISSLQKLYEASGIPSVSIYRIGKIHDRVHQELRRVGERAISTHKKYCLLDPSGQPSGLAQGKLEFLEPKEENEKKHDKEFVELLDREFEIKVNPIPISHLVVLLTREEILSLESILLDTGD